MSTQVHTKEQHGARPVWRGFWGWTCLLGHYLRPVSGPLPCRCKAHVTTAGPGTLSVERCSDGVDLPTRLHSRHFLSVWSLWQGSNEWTLSRILSKLFMSRDHTVANRFETCSKDVIATCLPFGLWRDSQTNTKVSESWTKPRMYSETMDTNHIQDTGSEQCWRPSICVLVRLALCAGDPSQDCARICSTHTFPVSFIPSAPILEF